MTSNKTKSIARISLSAITIVLLITQMSSMGFIPNIANASSSVTADSMKQQTNPIPELALTKVQKDGMIQKALEVTKLKNLSSSGWEYVTMDYLGVTTPTPEWKSVVLHFKLPKEFKTELNCNRDLEATVEIDLKTNQVISSDIPDKSTDCNGSIVFSKPSYDTDLPTFVPQASALTTTNGLLLAIQGDATLSSMYGGWTTISTPTLDETNLYSHMDKFVAHLYNQDFGTGKFLQVGWLATHIAGCPGCNIAANGKYLVYVDQSTFGDTEAHKVTGTNAPTYTPGSSAYVQILCNGASHYRIQVTSGGKFFVGESLVNCGTGTATNSPSNSVFFETKNTVASSSWSPYITSAVTGTSTKEYDTTTTIKNWDSSPEQYQTCGANAQFGVTSAITGTLTSGLTATWATLSATPHC
ncbi:MAG: hypothetical protein HY223_02450 [Thaumarchaeota archaeon]|nr:hypothetical protein [Nitrososphaerota archaeon]